MLILALGDAHIPDRATHLHPKLHQLLIPGRINQIITLGNVSDQTTLDRLRKITPELHAVKGEFDLAQLPLTKVITQGQLRIGLVSGFSVVPNDDPDALLIMARQLDVDVLLWGGSHRLETYEIDNKFFVNPGSCTGVPAGDHTPEAPSFVLLDVEGKTCTVYIYSIINDQVKVEKVSFEKE